MTTDTWDRERVAALKSGRYFVLKPKGNDAYARASRLAMLEYAEAIREENPDLAGELEEWASREVPATKVHEP